MYISPIHNIDKLQNFTLDEMIDIFEARIDGWHLKIADRIINGWKENGVDCINSYDNVGPCHYVPDSAWAALQIVLSYFEVVGEFKQGLNNTQSQNASSRSKFTWGVLDVFPNFTGGNIDIPEKLWRQLRTSLYHTSVKNNNIVLSHQDDKSTIYFDSQRQVVVIDPHNLIPHLRNHLHQFVTDLKNPHHAQLRANFQKAYKRRYSI